jgi:molybdopterin converting factor small subunit
MKINVKCYASLSDNAACNFRVPLSVNLTESATVKDAMATLGIPEKDVKLMFVNGRISDSGAPLADGDGVGLFPPVGGM